MPRLHTPHYMHKFKLIPTYNVECKIYIKERMKYLDIVDVECLWEMSIEFWEGKTTLSKLSFQQNTKCIRISLKNRNHTWWSCSHLHVHAHINRHLNNERKNNNNAILITIKKKYMY